MLNKILPLLFLVAVAWPAISQTGTIKGTVVNARTAEPLPFATVFINYTTLSAAANESGEFVLTNIPLGQHELVVTFVGHQTFQGTITVPDTIPRSYTIELASNPLREVEISSTRDKPWNKQYERFKKLFLGTSTHASLCTIHDPWGLEFAIDDDGFFNAVSLKILEIENRSLGYRMFYQLKKFKYGSAEFVIAGNIRFEELTPSDSAQVVVWKKNREDAYRGSSRHLFASLIEKNFRDEGFSIYNDQTGLRHVVRKSFLEANVNWGIVPYLQENLPFEEIHPNQFKINFPKRLEVHYLNKHAYPKIYRNVSHPVSWIEVQGGEIIINDQGIVLNPSKLVLSGEMSDLRVAELLPYDFIPEKTKKEVPAVEKVKPVNPLALLLEKPYLHTDKSHYYADEMLWYKGYINYREPFFRDSLSNVLYVELIDSASQIVSRKIAHIEQGRTAGNILITASMVPGDYTLRAYTQWMLNFDASLIFSKPIRILNSDETAKPLSGYVPNDSMSRVTINFEKEVFRPRERITVAISAVDELERFQPANFSVAVTDCKQVAPAENEGSILSEYEIGEVPLPGSISEEIGYHVQHGIELKGQVLTRKGKPIEGTVTLEQDNAAEGFTILTAKDGKFSFSDLPLYDSMDLYVLPKTTKGLMGRVVFDSAINIPPSRRVDKLKVDVQKANIPPYVNAWYLLSGTRVLKEVLIGGKRITPVDHPTTISAADFVIRGEDLREGLVTDVMSAIERKIPGMRVIGGKIVLGSIGTFGNPEALVLIDGRVINMPGDGSDFLSESAVDIISSLSPQEIERVEVIKYSGGSAYGANGANGVILITTRKPGNQTRLSSHVKGQFTRIKIPGFSVVDKFVSPDYAQNAQIDAATDYRSTVYWNSNVTTDANNAAMVSFFAADLPTQYRIVVEGVTLDGTPVRGEKFIVISDAD